MKVGDVKLRKVSRMKKNIEYPSLTISEELKVLGIEPNDMVVVSVDKNNNRVIIRKATREDIERIMNRVV